MIDAIHSTTTSNTIAFMPSCDGGTSIWMSDMMLTSTLSAFMNLCSCSCAVPCCVVHISQGEGSCCTGLSMLISILVQC